MINEQETIQFRNCRILREHEIIREDLWVRNGKIINPFNVFYIEKIQATKTIDCKNAIIAPGFIDLQINGGYGVDFSYDVNTVHVGIQKVAKKLLAHGVTSFCPTIVTSPSSVYHKVLPLIKKRNGNNQGAGILGLHLEGPFINIRKKGAHPENCILDFDNGITDLKEAYGTLENISIITLAPEKNLAEDVIKDLTKLGITVALGHSVANYSEGEIAVKSGANLLTHLFNAMLPFNHREPGLAGLISLENTLKNKTMYYGIISDGVHVHSAIIKTAFKVHPDGLILVTDAISGLGLPDGNYHIGQLNMEVINGKAFIAGTNTLCGSIAPMDQCIRLFKEATNCTTAYALEAASLHAAKCLGIEKSKGSLQFENDADFVFLNDNLQVLSTWIAGECVFSDTQ